ncbi:MAG: hypothetical protein ACREJD_14680 [Phycisphaerales bacterium]
MRIVPILSFALASMVASTGFAGSGRIIAIGDEWLLSDSAFVNEPAQAAQLATNIAFYFSGGSPSAFLVKSNAAAIPPLGGRGVLGATLATFMTNLGHTWVVDNAPALSLAQLNQYRAVFLAGDPGSGPANADILQQYVNAGGNVLIMVGTGNVSGGAPAEAAAWNHFLTRYGLQFGPTYFGLPPGNTLLDIPALPSSNPLGKSISLVEWGYGQSVTDLQPTNPLNEIAVYGNFTGTSPLPPTGDSAHQPIIGTYNLTTICYGDLNGDGLVDDSDFLLFVAAYNLLDCADPAMPAGCPADFNADGLVEDADFAIFVQSYDLLLCP